MANNQVVVTLEDSDIEKLDDLKGKEIGIQAQSSAVDAWNDSPVRKEVAGLLSIKQMILL